AASFVQGLLLPAERGIDHSENGQCRPVIWLSLESFLLLRPRSSKSQLRVLLVVCHAVDNAFQKSAREMNRIHAKRAFVRPHQGVLSCSGIAFDKCAS